MSLRKLIAAGMGVALLLVLLLVANQRDDGSETPATPMIAVNLPLTGPVAAFSGEYPLAFNMGLDAARERLGLAANALRVDVADNKGTARDSVTVFQKQALAGFDAYIVGLSTSAVAVSPQIDGTDTTQLLIAFESFITKAADNRIRIFPSYRLEGPKYVEYAKAVGAKRVFILSLNNAFIDEEFQVFVEPGLRAAGIEFERESFEMSTQDFRTLALKAAQYEPDLYLINGLSFHMLPLIKSLRSLPGVGIDGNLLCAMDLIDLVYQDPVAEALHGVVFISPPFEIPGIVPGADEWRDRFRAIGGKVPNYVQAYAYDTAQILAEAFVKSGDLTPASVQALFPYTGISGQMRLNEYRDLETDLGFVKITADGSREPVVLDLSQ